MGFMLVCTVAAKGIYRNGLPRVWLCKAEKGSLHYEINGTGTILPGETYGVYVPQGLRRREMFCLCWIWMIWRDRSGRRQPA